MRLISTDRLFVLTGAGISAESGLATFRGSGGLWNGHRVEEVATPEAWDADPELVWRFYSMRRRDALAAQPNAAHTALARIEEKLGDRFYLCTQNVDDLHERGRLEETLVVVMGEFGRTPKLNTAGGRDHWPRVFSVLLAGGGVAGQLRGHAEGGGEGDVLGAGAPAALLCAAEEQPVEGQPFANE